MESNSEADKVSFIAMQLGACGLCHPSNRRDDTSTKDPTTLVMACACFCLFMHATMLLSLSYLDESS